MKFDFSYDEAEIRLDIAAEKQSLFARLLSKKEPENLEMLPREETKLRLILADLRNWAEQFGEDLQISSRQIRMGHGLLARIGNEAAQVLSLPPLPEYTLKTDAEGLLGHNSFKLAYEWQSGGKPRPARRIGAILETENGARRLPHFILQALEIADKKRGDGHELADDWEALAKFRHALEPESGGNAAGARASMTDFLRGLQISLVDGFSIQKSDSGDEHFEILPFARKKLRSEIYDADDDSEEAEERENISESEAELAGALLNSFQLSVREKGGLPAYSLGSKHYMVVERDALPVLKTMAQKQKAPKQEREEFIRNPSSAVRQAVERDLENRGRLAGLSDEEREAYFEEQTKSFIETKEYSERVIGLRRYVKPDASIWKEGGDVWLPEVLGGEKTQSLADVSKDKTAAEVKEIIEKIEGAIEEGRQEIPVKGANGAEVSIPVTEEMKGHFEDIYREKVKKESGAGGPEPDGAIILDTRDNFDEVGYCPHHQRRAIALAADADIGLSTDLFPHQVESLALQRQSWQAGMPGILNADEQGLGKTLQTIAMLRFLQKNAEAAQAEAEANSAPPPKSYPILIVAPVSLLGNWEQEAKRHTGGEMTVSRFYGAHLQQYRKSKGKETEGGEQLLQLDELLGAIDKGIGHRFCLLTTYETVVNYQHSLARIEFSAIVFDEIQALKNPYSLRSCAARALKGHYRIGLTGTPIENETTDLWAVADQTAPGHLGSLQDFRKLYGNPTQENMQDLHERVFAVKGGSSPLAFRRLKENAASDLPVKKRFLHPCVMPKKQEEIYNQARGKMASGAKGAALKMLQHIRNVSIHPDFDMQGDNSSYIQSSARLAACFALLRDIKAKGERALVFIESRIMQHRFIELVKQEFGLADVPHINGATPPPQRQKIVAEFQRNLEFDSGFAVLVLGPRAAGTGLTLTAATHVIHLSRWWNPAVEEQCNDRVHRIGQTRAVSIHIPLAIHSVYKEGSFDCVLQGLMHRKRSLARNALWPMGDMAGDSGELAGALEQAEEGAGSDTATGDIAATAMANMFAKSGEKGRQISAHCYEID